MHRQLHPYQTNAKIFNPGVENFTRRSTVRKLMSRESDGLLEGMCEVRSGSGREMTWMLDEVYKDTDRVRGRGRVCKDDVGK